MSTLILFLTGIGFILIISSTFFTNEFYSGIIDLLGLFMMILALFLMRKEKR